MLAFIILVFFDKNAAEEILLIPEWAFLSIMLYVSAIHKEQYITLHQENSSSLFGMALHMNGALSIIASVFFCIALMYSRGYIEFQTWQKSLLSFSNVTIALGACLLYMRAHVQHMTLEIKHNKALKNDADKAGEF